MAIKVGDRLPAGKFSIMTKDGPGALTTEDLFGGKKVVFFSVPGAFTPTCSNIHLPGYVKHAAEIKAKGVDTIACMSVNDVFVMNAWGKDRAVGDKVLMYASDYPHGESHFPHTVDLVMDWKNTSEARTRKLFWENPVKFYTRSGLK